MKCQKKAISPLVATILLIAFALVIGLATMNWGKAYATSIDGSEPKEKVGSGIIISFEKIDTPLKELQIKYITGQITLEQYLQKEKELLNKS